MKPTVEQVENLLALKRHESCEEGYWQDFLCEFHQRQREQVAACSGVPCFLKRFAAWTQDLGPAKWAYGSGLAYAAVAVAFLLMPKGVDVENATPSPVNYQVVPITPSTSVEQLDKLDLSPTTQGNAGEQVF